MLTIPAAEETVGKYILRNRPVDELSEKQEVAFLNRMKQAQKQLITDRHYLDMDTETRMRANMVLAGTYHGQVITGRV